MSGLDFSDRNINIPTIVAYSHYYLNDYPSLSVHNGVRDAGVIQALAYSIFEIFRTLSINPVCDNVKLFCFRFFNSYS